MRKLLASAYKEVLLLLRDWGGLIILFVMPLVLVVTITLIQDSTFKTFEDTKIAILWIDNDQGKVAATIHQELTNAKSFNLVTATNEKEAQDLVVKGTYKMAIVIPQNLSSYLENKVSTNVEGILSRFGLEEPQTSEETTNTADPKEIRLYFDPATNQNFKNAIHSNVEKMLSKIETESIYKAFQEQITDNPEEKIFDTSSKIVFREISPQDKKGKSITPNSVQHNIPAWTLFAIFFIIVPLSINIVKEKNQGTFVRLRTQPVSYLTVLGGKTVVYLTVCLIQFTLMLLIGVYFLPTLGLPQLDVSGKIPMLFLVAIFAGLAAIGLGVLLGTIAKTQEQSAPFGATFVVILAALGGVWVPVFIMPTFMQFISNISPMNWGLNAFYDVFLRNGSVIDVLPDIGLLFLFFICTTVIAVLFNEKKHAV